MNTPATTHLHADYVSDEFMQQLAPANRMVVTYRGQKGILHLDTIAQVSKEEPKNNRVDLYLGPVGTYKPSPVDVSEWLEKIQFVEQ